ncbi:uncharacterized protein LOC112348041 [Selaginella moellendorffii]|uniref:uncharacterized protein LOC112348041 n=1 Tax=Selaginella moellendorffii TaxID=88036 RepID=UPI000D1C7695|nr:uncharacterized protein LOC112348041 [Selaginella moellendorffii]|eukprot:XP_024535738.1 uncharacterized protein LOC112348041 [Selaginella moellendorffii]
MDAELHANAVKKYSCRHSLLGHGRIFSTIQNRRRFNVGIPKQSQKSSVLSDEEFLGCTFSTNKRKQEHQLKHSSIVSSSSAGQHATNLSRSSPWKITLAKRHVLSSGKRQPWGIPSKYPNSSEREESLGHPERERRRSEKAQPLLLSLSSRTLALTCWIHSWTAFSHRHTSDGSVGENRSDSSPMPPPWTLEMAAQTIFSASSDLTTQSCFHDLGKSKCSAGTRAVQRRQSRDTAEQRSSALASLILDRMLSTMRSSGRDWKSAIKGRRKSVARTRSRDPKSLARTRDTHPVPEKLIVPLGPIAMSHWPVPYSRQKPWWYGYTISSRHWPRTLFPVLV